MKKLWLTLLAGGLLFATYEPARAQQKTCGISSLPAGCTGTLATTSTYVCDEVSTDGSSANGGVMSLVVASNGTFTLSNATNGNQSTFNTFQSLSGTYCINTATETGYIIPSQTGSCGLAMVLDSSETKIHVMDTTDGNAGVVDCIEQ